VDLISDSESLIVSRRRSWSVVVRYFIICWYSADWCVVDVCAGTDAALFDCETTFTGDITWSGIGFANDIGVVTYDYVTCTGVCSCRGQWFLVFSASLSLICDDWIQ
jgi:hypothetical protein